MELTPEAQAAARDFQKLVTNLRKLNPDFREVIARTLGEADHTAVEDVVDEGEPLTMLDYGDAPLEGNDIFDIIEVLKVDRHAVLKGSAITLNDLRNIRSLLIASHYDLFVEPGLAMGAMIYIAISPTGATQAEQRAFFDRIYDDIRAGGNLSYEVQMLCAGIRQDPGYRLAWIANLAQSFVMAGSEHFAAQQGAANFLDTFAHCDSRKDEHFQHPPEPEVAPAAEDASAARNEHLHAFSLDALLNQALGDKRRYFQIELDKDDPAPYETVQFLLRQLTGRDLGKPRLRYRDGMLVYVLEQENAEVAIIQVPAQ